MTSKDIIRVIIATAILGIVSTAHAADLTTPPSRAPIPAAANRNPWQMRLRALGVITTDSGRVDGLPGSDLSFSDTVVPEFDISYFFTENIAAELILGTTYAKVHGGGSISALGEIGKTWLLPPTLTLQYHFTDLGAFRPYVGAGLNYTLFYNQSGKSARSLDVKNSFGVALQAGFDYMIDDHWGVNVDAKKIFLRPDFDANVGGANVSGKARLDPWLLGAGVTYRF
ncbi:MULTISPECIES: OmpW/AlkL family protein [Rhizobium]|uniref:OmpW family protein n=3 Tax=Rhizobium TaxID=379 RepID=A0A6P1CE73_RHITR|nr:MULTISPECIES: OmpW family protein [Rhizobium]AGB73511.1 outer membrane protein, OmpW family [Rhizobium tropici CIAT 899]AYG70438.1 OmpW family protein [Rhizobium sp. CCGE531]AYG76937.1 OmpW family protein [Rhizobium sp. CCGE532]ENN84770.1 outer membrane protein, OmpW family [Rhizobium freirei PRF 81]MBB4244889.1 outer membrane protein [Rhizobium tropici]